MVLSRSGDWEQESVIYSYCLAWYCVFSNGKSYMDYTEMSREDTNCKTAREASIHWNCYMSLIGPRYSTAT